MAVLLRRKSIDKFFMMEMQTVVCSEKVKLWYLRKKTEIIGIKAEKDEKEVFFSLLKKLRKRKTIVMRKRRGKEQRIRRAKKLKNIVCLKGESM